MMVYYALVCRVKFHSVAVAVWKTNARNINVRRCNGPIAMVYAESKQCPRKCPYVRAHAMS